MATKKKKKKKARGPLLSPETKVAIRVLLGLLCVAVTVIVTASLISYAFSWKADYSLKTDPQMWRETVQTQNICGKMGYLISDFLVGKLFGLGAYCIPVFLVALTVACFRIRKVKLLRTFLLCLMGCIVISLAAAYVSGFWDKFVLSTGAGGSYGYFANKWLGSIVGRLGAGLIIGLLLILWLVLCSRKVALAIDNLIYRTFHRKPKEEAVEEDSRFEDTFVLGEPEDEPSVSISVEDTVPAYEPAVPEEPEEVIDLGVEEKPVAGIASDVKITVEQGGFNPEENIAEDDMDHLYNPRLDLSKYEFPSVSLLDDYRDKWYEISLDEMERNKNRIVHTLGTYKIRVDSISAKKGPTVTLYKIRLAEGTRIAQVKKLEEDIAMSLAAKGVRVLVLEDAIGIEVANEKPSVVPLKMILNSPQYREKSAKMELPVALGITVTNEPFFLDLAKMPHLLVAGATGMGKSVGLNAIIASLLYAKHPSEMKFVMVDPKKVELDFYAALEKHYLAVLPDADEVIITDTTKVVHTLRSLCTEMDERYDLLRDGGVRKITEYNEKFLNRKLNPLKGHKYLPYIVVVIDEFADLLMTAGREIEEPIARLAQKARAVGIHLVIATQRPTTDVITGTIKANFNSRIAFKVNSGVDSKTIIDSSGAQRLIGRGDMLVLYPGSDMVRVQCALIETAEIERITKFIGNQRGYSHPFWLPEYHDESEESAAGSVNLTKRDALFEEAAKILVQTQQGSTSMLQRKLNLGYNRAGRLVDQLEAAGIVGPANGSKSRDVLVSDFDTLDRILESLDHQ
ncbi:MAG: DNA translocase FtsK 4TM domain-containing protein [Bacteroidales bacterium]|nr:DNA translocase FtsK 4TM domain-containing protein [Bacteroidales bacterium]MBQ6081972.1 DNA translocase FtsK 4TM domain-containing protein [Bacteroidales bacterium]